MGQDIKQDKDIQAVPLIDLSALARHGWQHMKRLWWLLLALVLLGSGGMYLRRVLNYTPQYKAEAMFSVSASYVGVTDMTSYSYYYDNAAAKQLVETFPTILATDMMKEALRVELGCDVINGKITVSSMAETNMFILAVTSPSAQDAYDIIKAVMNVYPRISPLVIGNTQLHVAAAPELPTAPYNSVSWKSAVAKGALLGVVLGVLLLLALSVLTRTVNSVDDVTKLVNLKCLTRVPKLRGKRRSQGSGEHLIISDLEPGSAFVESFRVLKMRLLREMKSGRDQVIMFTSSVPSEGKSTIAANTAIALASEGKRVLLIDADLRGQSIKANLGIEKSTVGLGGFLNNVSQSYSLARYRDTSVYVFADDDTVSSPISMLKHGKLRGLFKELRPLVDYIVVDTPPCNMMADASILARYADKVVYVIRNDHASQSQIYDGVQSISSVGNKICGFVYNCDTKANTRYGYGYGYGKYGYGKYGYSKYGYGKKDRAAAEEHIEGEQ